MTGLPSHFQMITSAIEFTKRNHDAISNNVANVNTPGFKTKHISFGELLEQIEKQGKNSGGEVPNFDLTLVEGLKARNDGNNVDLDKELANLKKNSIMHQTLTQLLGTQMGIMRRAISGQ